MNSKIFLFAAISVLAASAFTNTATARGHQRMMAVDWTKGGKITDNGVNDGRFCQIYNRQVFDHWTETVRMVKTKSCNR